MTKGPNSFGEYLLSLTDQVAQLNVQISHAQMTLRGIKAMPARFDVSGLCENHTLTDDPLLDVALVLSMNTHSSSDIWAENISPIYQAIKDMQERLKVFRGTILYDGTTQFFNPYCNEIYIGRVDCPQLLAIPTYQAFHTQKFQLGHHSNLLAVKIAPFESSSHITNNNKSRHLNNDQLDITDLFNPYHSHSNPHDLRGVYLGSDEIRNYLERLQKLQDHTTPRWDLERIRDAHSKVTSFLEQVIATA